MFEGWEISPEDTDTILNHLQNFMPLLDRSNNNVTIVEIGRFQGQFTQALRRTWNSSTIFTIDDDQQLITADPIAYARTMQNLAEIDAVIIRSTSPPRFAWPRAWSYDLLVVDLGSDYDKIRNNIRWWSRSAKRYADGTSGIMLINLPCATGSKDTARELFVAEENITIETVTHSWSIVRYR